MTLDSLPDGPVSASRQLDVPQWSPEPAVNEEPTPPIPPPSDRAEGRKKRKKFPVAVALWDDIPVYESPYADKVIYRLQTGDFVRVLKGKNEEVRTLIHPGLDILLETTNSGVQPSGENLPDKQGWISHDALTVLDDDQAHDFLQTLEPVTVGNDASFSTLAFYERAMKNPDPVVHRVIGPRMIAILGIHEDYSPSWRALYRDPDPKIRSVSLAALRERGVGNSRPMIEDLIRRISELTQGKAQGETEAEALAVLSVLKASGHPRAQAALQSFVEDWQKTQGPRLNEAVHEFLKPSELKNP